MRRLLKHILPRGLRAQLRVLGGLYHDAAILPPAVEVIQGPPAGRYTVLAPHPDDEVIGCGGLLAMVGTMAAAGGEAAASVVYVTDGRASRRVPAEAEAMVARRRAEAQESCRRLGVGQVRRLDLPERDRAAYAAAAAPLAGMLQDLRPDVVLVPTPLDLHPDHLDTGRLFARAAEQAWPAGSRPEVWLYEVYAPLVPNLVLDITPVLADKLAALRAHASQHESIQLCALVEGINRHRSLFLWHLPGVTHAEAYVRTSLPVYLRILRDLGGSITLW